VAPPAPRPTRAARYVTLFPRRRVIRAPKTFSDMSFRTASRILLLESDARSYHVDHPSTSTSKQAQV